MCWCPIYYDILLSATIIEPKTDSATEILDTILWGGDVKLDEPAVVTVVEVQVLLQDRGEACGAGEFVGGFEDTVQFFVF